jgi:hypothetical protein
LCFCGIESGDFLGLGGGVNKWKKVVGAAGGGANQ